MLIPYMLLPVILPSKFPNNIIIQTELDGILTSFVGAEVFHGVVVDTIVLPLEIFWGRESLVTLKWSRGRDFAQNVSRYWALAEFNGSTR